jgi:hypothetical protein
MPTSLDALRAKFLRRVSVVDSAFERRLTAPKSGYRSDRFAFQEGIVSQLWQYWCIFCRDLIIESAKGASTRSGLHTTSPYSTNSDLEIAYVAKQLSNKVNITTIKALSGGHLEPTWGDINKLNLIVNGIGSTNNPTMASAFGAGTLLLDLQICRNACAHLNYDSIQRISLARARYNLTNFHHPSDVIFWIDPITNDFLWRSWVDEMDTLSELATY